MSKSRNQQNKLSSAPQYVKLIGGRWRGTKIPVVLKEKIRPTPSRVRETLFNWLQASIPGSHCLDLFSGSGALGLEAISRGASHVTFVDNDNAVHKLLSEQLERLSAHEAELINNDGPSFVKNSTKQFDIVFLDPPFSKFNIEDLLQQLADSDTIKPGGLIYVESSADKFPQNLPINWKWQRQSKAGQVEYGLISTHKY